MNFWLAIQDLSFQGLDPDLGNIYMTPDGYALHSITKFKVLDAVREQLEP